MKIAKCRLEFVLGIMAFVGGPVWGQDRDKSKANAKETKDGGFSRFADSVTIEPNIVFGDAGNRPLRIDALKPKTPSSGKLPIVFFVHGGGWRQGDRKAGYPVVAPFVASGHYVAFTVEYRLSAEAKWPAQIHDCKAGLRWVRKHAAEFGGDPERIALIGPSAGGHLVALMGLTANDPEFEGTCGTPGESTAVSCVVDIFGPADLVGLARVVEANGNTARSALHALFGKTVDEGLEEMKRASPLHQVKPTAPPFLILHGTKDRLVPLTESTRLRDRLREAGVNVAMATVNGGEHGPLGEQANRVMYQFLENRLRGVGDEVKDLEIDLSNPPHGTAKGVGQ